MGITSEVNVSSLDSCELESQGAPQGSQSDQLENKIWNIIQGVPGLNVGYGTVRLVIYISKGNKDEALRSAIGIAKGLVQSAAIVGSVFIGPVIAAPLVTLPLAAGVLTGIVTESIQGTAHVVIFVIEHSGELRKKIPAESKEKMIYDEVKEIPTIGAVYSAVRAPVYAIKGDTVEVQTSGIGVVSGTAITAINVGVNVIPGLDAEGKSFIQKISQSVIQLLSRKVLEDVSKKKISLEYGIKLVKNFEEKCDTMEIITLESEDEATPGHGQEDEPAVKEESLDKQCGYEKQCVNDGDASDKKSTIKETLKRIAKVLKRENKRGNEIPVLINNQWGDQQSDVVVMLPRLNIYVD